MRVRDTFSIRIKLDCARHDQGWYCMMSLGWHIGRAWVWEVQPTPVPKTYVGLTKHCGCLKTCTGRADHKFQVYLYTQVRYLWRYPIPEYLQVQVPCAWLPEGTGTYLSTLVFVDSIYTSTTVHYSNMPCYCWRDSWKSMKRSRVLLKQMAMWSEYWTIQRAATMKRVRKVRCMQQRQKIAESGSHIPASVRYLRYISSPLKSPQSNMLEDILWDSWERDMWIGWHTGLAWVGEVQPRPVPAKPIPVWVCQCFFILACSILFFSFFLLFLVCMIYFFTIVLYYCNTTW